MKTKNKFYYILQHTLQALFCLASINLAIITAIAYVCGVLQVFVVLNLVAAGGELQKGAILTIIGIIAAALIILAILIALFILLYKLCKRYFKPLRCDNLEYFFISRRWKDVIVAFVMWAIVFFGVRYLYNLAMPFDISIICYVLSAMYLFVALTMLGFWLFYKFWFIRQPKENKAKMLALFKEIEEKRKEKEEVNKSLKEKEKNKKTKIKKSNNEILEQENENINNASINEIVNNQENIEILDNIETTEDKKEGQNNEEIKE